ncbi:MAG: hypothetical protein MJ240_06290 [Kiritimatiellae bacterium]|nr:hypothetical protein [Kiritimatiellia bacterium]
MFDPYEQKRRKARQERQRQLARVVTSGLPIDGDPKECRRPVARAGDTFDAVLESFSKDIFKAENRFFDDVLEQWDTLFPNCPARPGRWAAPNRLILYVATAGQSFAMRPKLPAITRTLKTLPSAPKERFSVIVQIHA